MYVGIVMREQIIEKSDERIGVKCSVKINDKKTKYPSINAHLYSKSKGYDKFANFTENNVVFVLTELEHLELLDKIAKINELGKELDINKKETDKINNKKIAQLQKELDSTKTELDQLKNSYNNLNNDYEILENENENLKTKHANLIKFNKQLDASNTNSQEIIQQLKDIMQYKEQELKETIQNQQQHIDEITHKYQLLLPLKDYIPVKQYYDDIDKLKEELKASENKIVKINANVETQLAEQKQELESIHHNQIIKLIDEKHILENKFTDDKAQLLVAYNNDLNHYKMQYNELAIVYNQLVEQLQSLTRLNTLLSGKHNGIKKDKEKVELIEMSSEHVEIPMEKYVPKK